MIPFIDLAKQQERIRERIEARIRTVLDHGRYILGPEVTELEEELADFIGVKHCVGCSNGTDALLMSLMAHEIGPGDTVFTTPFTFFATAEVIALLGARPVFVDIDADTYNIDTAKLRETVEKTVAGGNYNARAIIPVDLFGQPADYDAINAIALEYDLAVIQDAAQAFGAEYKGSRCPAQGQIGATSFFPAKPLGAYGDAGAVFTNDDEIHNRLLSILVHGRNLEDKYNNIRLGLNARLDTIQAAILLEKFAIYEDEIERRQQIAALYEKHLSGIPDLKLPRVIAGNKSVWAQYCVQHPEREAVIATLKEAGIPTAIYYPLPLHLQTAFEDVGPKPGDFPVAEATAKQIFALPFHPYLDEASIGQIAQAMRI